ncbi:5-oxoprolinase subunit PxpB [Pontibacter sp. E15-1]|uniref:5-oxoprolinase subunit PxpB n=1 Tax=Pontibacter sp. E15-1 TaxID=2919918 RepID=UPI001F50212A|nr:5-oxoprolinase subunit PxpB [Pontibacter sp. E15-1]MCJ8163420.1 5-oxoprolinase subunit PxpB [Pontibacter sp. E15-1]
MRKLKESDIPTVRLYPLGDAAVVVHFGDAIGEETHRQVRAFVACLEEHPFEGLVEYVPAFTTVTVYYNPWVISEKGELNPYTKVTGFLQRMLPLMGKGRAPLAQRVVEIPVAYGGEYGPDLDAVAAHTGLQPGEVIALHTQPDYRVYMIGFAPGFPYLGGISERLVTPRRSSPRPDVPAGTVGIAGNQTGVYPLQTPGGWQLIGRTPIPLFNPANTPPSLLQAGDLVRFVAISAEKYTEMRKEQHES